MDLLELASEPAPCYARRGRIKPPRLRPKISPLTALVAGQKLL